MFFVFFSYSLNTIFLKRLLQAVLYVQGSLSLLKKCHLYPSSLALRLKILVLFPLNVIDSSHLCYAVAFFLCKTQLEYFLSLISILTNDIKEKLKFKPSGKFPFPVPKLCRIFFFFFNYSILLFFFYVLKLSLPFKKSFPAVL